MTQLKDIARVTVAGAPDNPGPGGLLEDQVLFVWSIAHTRLSLMPEGVRKEGGGLVGPVNMGGIIREVFKPAGKAKLDQLASDIRQVFKRSGTARCVDFTKGKEPVWWVSDVAPDNIVAVARWVAVNAPPAAGGHNPNGVKLTKREERLTAHEAGEDRDPAPVEVTPAPPAKPAPDALNKHEQALADFKARQASLLSFMIDNVKVGTGITARELAVCTGIQETAVRRALDALVSDGYVFARAESPAEKEVRQRPDGKRVFGRAGTLYSAGRGAAKRTALPACVAESGIYSGPARAARDSKRSRLARAVAVEVSTISGRPGLEMRPKGVRQLELATGESKLSIEKVLRSAERAGLCRKVSGRWGLSVGGRSILADHGVTAVQDAFEAAQAPRSHKVAAPAAPEPAPLVGVVSPPPAAPVLPGVHSALRHMMSAMSALGAPLADIDSTERLINENNKLKMKVAELETSLAAVKRALGS